MQSKKTRGIQKTDLKGENGSVKKRHGGQVRTMKSTGLATKEKEKEGRKAVKGSFHMQEKVELWTGVCILVIR